MSKNQIIIVLVVLTLVGTIWGSVQDKKSENLERQLAAMKKQPVAAAPVADEAVVNQSKKALEMMKSQNKKLLETAATLKGTIASQKEELTGLKQQVEEITSGSQAAEVLQAQLDTRTADLTALEENIAVVKAELEEKSTALVAAEEVKNTLANNVDVYSAKSQQLSAEVEECGLRASSLEKALEERTKILQASEEELARTKLNMNVLLSKIGAQNKSLAILEETRIALTKELAAKFLTIEDLERHLSAQVTVEAAIVEDVEESQVEEAAPAEEAPVEH